MKQRNEELLEVQSSPNIVTAMKGQGVEIGWVLISAQKVHKKTLMSLRGSLFLCSHVQVSESRVYGIRGVQPDVPRAVLETTQHYLASCAQACFVQRPSRQARSQISVLLAGTVFLFNFPCSYVDFSPLYAPDAFKNVTRFNRWSIKFVCIISKDSVPNGTHTCVYTAQTYCWGFLVSMLQVLASTLL